MAVLAIWPGIGAIYDLLARPMMQSLPEGTRDDRDRGRVADIRSAEGDAARRVPRGAAVRPVPGVGLRRARSLLARKRIALPIVISSTVLFLLGVAYCYFVVFGMIFQRDTELRADRDHAGSGHRGVTSIS